MISLMINFDCAHCHAPNGIQEVLKISDADGISTQDSYQRGDVTSVWHHDPKKRSPILLRCKACNATHSFDYGPFELHCHTSDLDQVEAIVQAV